MLQTGWPPRTPGPRPILGAERPVRSRGAVGRGSPYGVGGSPGKIWPWIFQGPLPVHNSK